MVSPGLAKTPGLRYYLSTYANSQVAVKPHSLITAADSGKIAATLARLDARMEGLPREALEQVAAYFQVLAEPTRLALLNLLRDGEHKVGDLAQLAGSTPANVSRHLTHLMQHGLVGREGRGTSVYYRIADPSVYQLCDLVCGSLARRLDQVADRRSLFNAALPAPPAPARNLRRRS